MKGKLFLFILLLLSIVPFVLADQTQLYSKIYLNPYYRESTIANTQYNYTLSVNPPDGLTQVYSATLTFEAYFAPSVNITLKVNNQTCNTPNFYISTTYAGSAQMTASFDCSNIINQTGNYSVQLTMTKNTGAINGWLDLTFTNKPRPTMKVFGTEYQIGQTAKAWLQLLDSNGTYINNGACFIDIYSPDNLEYIEQAQMISLNHDGIYYYDLQTPTTEGVYPVIARCYYEAVDVHYYATTYFLNIGTLDSAWLPVNLQLVDGDKITFKETLSGGIRKLDVGLNVTNMSSCLNVSEALLTGMEIYAYGRFDSVDYDNITLSVYNYSSATWVVLSNFLIESSASMGVSNTFFFNNLTNSGLYNESQGGLKVRFTDTNLTDGGDSKLELDQFYVSCNQLANPTWQEVMGSSEIHVSNTTNIITGVMAYLQDVIYPYLVQMWNKLLGIETQLNTTINLSTEINTTTHTIDQKLDILNQTMLDKFTEKDLHIQSAYDNMTSQVNNLSNNVTQNFNQTWEMILALNSSQGQNNSVILSFLQNLTQTLADTQTQISNVNQSLNQQILDTTNSTQNLINSLNTSTQTRFNEIQSYLDNLTLLIQTNHNITQENISTLMSMLVSVNSSVTTDISNLNTSLQVVRTDILTEINQTYNYLVAMNQSLSTDLLSINTSLSNAIQDFRSETQNNISSLFSTLSQISGDLNLTRQEIQNLSLQLNQTEQALSNQLTSINSTLSADLNWLKNDSAYMIEFLSDLNISIEGLKINLTSNEALIYSVYNNLSSQISQNTTAVLNQIIATNESLSTQISQVKNDTQGIISQIGTLNSTMTAQYDNLTLFMGDLQTQMSENHNITQDNISTLFSLLGSLNTTTNQNYLDLNQSITDLGTNVYEYYTDLNTTIYTELNNINVSINQTGENVLSEIAMLKNLLLSVNNSLTQEIIENRNTMLLINQSLSAQVESFQNSTEDNFNTTFLLLNGLEEQNNLTHELLGNLSVQLNQTSWDIQNRIDLMNASVMGRFDTLDSNMTTIISLLNNMSLSSNSSIQSILNLLGNLSVQIDTNHNITQSNISTIFLRLNSLNSTMTTYYIDLRDILSNMNGTLLYINETNSWILQELNISAENLSLVVTAPNKCLEDTNWLAKAQVFDRFGNILSPLDGMRCNMTTDLWGTENMTYMYIDSKFKYIHVCDMGETTFNWSVNCEWV